MRLDVADIEREARASNMHVNLLFALADAHARLVSCADWLQYALGKLYEPRVGSAERAFTLSELRATLAEMSARAKRAE
jgi:hypothetical protein